MLSGKSRPVPSKAALKILYQLAYISSGTAVGLGLLCAEERRRRIQVLQRIADNAKRIRQSPRYYQNAAGVVQETRSLDTQADDFGWAVHELQEHMSDKRTDLNSILENCMVKGPDLPSVVDRAYAQVNLDVEQSPNRFRRHHPVSQKSVSSRKGRGANLTGGKVVFSGKDENSSPGLNSDSTYRLRGDNLSPVTRTVMRIDRGVKTMISNRTSQYHTPSKDLEQKGQSHTKGLDSTLDQTTKRMQYLQRRCDEHLAAGRSWAARGVLHQIKKCSETLHTYEKMAHKVFLVALKGRHINTCSRIIRMNGHPLRNFEAIWRFESFLCMCDEVGAYGAILELLEIISPSDLDRLSPKSCEIIAFACNTATYVSNDLGDYFHAAFERVPDNLRGRIRENIMFTRLKEVSQTSGDLNQMQQELQDQDILTDEQGSRDTRIAQLLSALDSIAYGNPKADEFEMLKVIRQSGLDGINALSQVALILAEKGAWMALKILPSSWKCGNSIAPTSDAVWKFNKVLELCSTHFSRPEQWKFVTELIRDHGFRPNTDTHDVLLQSFITRRDVCFIPKWLRYLETIGHKVELSGKLAARLLVRFYREYRPSQVLLTWLCRNLTHTAPSLAGYHFADLVKESIGYDIRFAEGNEFVLRQRFKRDEAIVRLGRLLNSKGGIPSPGYRHQGQLYFEHPSHRTLTPSTRPNIEAISTSNPASDASGTPVRSVWTRDRDIIKPTPNAGNDPAFQNFDIPPENMQSPNGSTTMLTGFASSKEQMKSPNRNPSLSSLQDIDEELRGYSTPTKRKYVDVTSEGHHDARNSVSSRDIILAYSLGKYDMALEFYKRSLDSVGLPLSVTALQVAVQAKLCKGDLSGGNDLLLQAKAAGMNITGALGPIIIHKIKTANLADKTEVNNIRLVVMDYYRMNDEQGFKVNHHVGTTAASYLINNNRAIYGLNLLRDLYKSSWAKKRPLDIVAMSVFVKGYTQVKDLSGVYWTVRSVLSKDMPIDEVFLRELNRASRKFSSLQMTAGRKTDFEVPPWNPGARIREWQLICRERRTKQRKEVVVLGNRLVKALAKCANHQRLPTIGVDERYAFEEALLGKSEEHVAFDEVVPFKEQMPPYPQPLRFIYASRGERDLHDAERAFRMNPNDRYQSRPLSSWNLHEYRRWLKRYRAFLRHRAISPDGKLSVVRFCISEAPKRRRRA
ncbi:hypothetical protein M433DRAFT_149383 [Acidomyces richmondensis BFW]|nr:MAG: hypothetical protein FE78DRAFT_89394 [Acidomyces sp. 'richmondensis']KYG50030.1 hypothetical protein M433DRAFT_149383 [Acidomyces richmondensis BFW]